MNNLTPRFLVAAKTQRPVCAPTRPRTPSTYLIAQTGQLNEARLPGINDTDYRAKQNEGWSILLRGLG
jgi:hypothetical protein